MDRETTKPENRRKIQERRKDEIPAWALAAAIPKDRRADQGDRRRSSK